jgi:hypothetical protein
LTEKQLARKRVIRKAFVEYVRYHYCKNSNALLSRSYDRDMRRDLAGLDKILLSAIKDLSIRGLTGTVDGVKFFVEADECEDYSRFLKSPVKVSSV